jgi:carbon-monoxide dehydrogenase medium subunit
MAIVHEFEYLKPDTLNEVINILVEYGNRSKILAGGTDLAIQIKDGLETPVAVVDIKGIKELKRLGFKGNRLFIGALVTFSDLIDSDLVREKFLVIWEASKTVASRGIRNRATMVGNICSAVPSLDSGPALLLYEADVIVKGVAGKRKIPILEWFLGPKKTALNQGEIVTGISVPLPERKYSGCYVKLGRYAGEDLAQAGVGILALEGNSYRVAFCAVGPVSSRAKKIESLLNGRELTDSLIEEAKKVIPQEISPISDIRASKDYKIHMVKIMFERGIKIAVSRLTGKSPESGPILI